MTGNTVQFVVEVQVAQSFTFFVVFCRSLLVFLSFYCIVYAFNLQPLIATLISFWPLYLTIVLSVLLQFTASDCPFDILLASLFDHCIVCASSIYSLWLPPLISFFPLYLTIVLSVLLQFTASDCPFDILFSSLFDHCIVCASSIYDFWLPLWCLQAFLSKVQFLRWWVNDVLFILTKNPRWVCFWHSLCVDKYIRFWVRALIGSNKRLLNWYLLLLR
jgi:hypothetical protein